MKYLWQREPGKHPHKVTVEGVEHAVHAQGHIEIADAHRWPRTLALADLGFAPESLPPGVHTAMRALLRRKGIKGF